MNDLGPLLFSVSGLGEIKKKISKALVVNLYYTYKNCKGLVQVKQATSMKKVYKGFIEDFFP